MNFDPVYIGIIIVIVVCFSLVICGCIIFLFYSIKSYFDNFVKILLCLLLIFNSVLVAFFLLKDSKIEVIQPTNLNINHIIDRIPFLDLVFRINDEVNKNAKGLDDYL